jgi:hypothetical protein
MRLYFWIERRLAARGYHVYHPLRVWAAIFSPRHWWFIREHHGLTKKNRETTVREYRSLAADFYDGMNAINRGGIE